MVQMIVFVSVMFVSSVLVNAGEPTEEKANAKKAIDGKNAALQLSTDARGQALARYLSGKKFVGRFTVDGSSNGQMKVEEYDISSCEKLPQDDLYRLNARIKYGNIDQEVPLEIKILFAGETPVITLDSMWIPGMGTFDARVLIRRDRYCGTWKHDDKGGHLFGKLTPNTADAPNTTDENDKQ